MATRFIAGFLAAGVLLSGSAFAFAPEFTEDLPTVIITDKVPVALQSGANVYDDDGVASATTEYVFRFTGAFDARDYFGAGDAGLNGNTFEGVKFLFTESSYDEVTTGTFNIGAIQPANMGTLSINDEVSVGVPPIAADFAGAPLLNANYTAADGLLDFRNIDFSGTNSAINTGFDAIGDVTGDDISVSISQRRWVNLYLNGDDAATSDTVGSTNGGFLVITTIDGDDELTDSLMTNPWAPIPAVSGSTFSGWFYNATGTLLLTPNPGTAFITFGTGATTGYTANPTTAVAATVAGDPATVSLTAAPTQAGFANWSLRAADAGLALEANMLYRLRLNVYSSSTTTKDIFRASISSALEAGVGTMAFNNAANVTNNGPTLPTATSTEIFAYLRAMADGAGEINVETVNFGNGTGQNFTIDSYEVSAVDPEAMGTGTVIINRGGPVTVAAGEGRSLVSDGLTGFAPDGTTVGISTKLIAGNSSNTPTFARSANSLSITWLANNSAPAFTRFAFEAANLADADALGTFEAEVGKLYIMDAWMSTTTPAATAFPNAQPSMTAAGTNGGWGTYVLAPAFGTGIQADSRCYSAVLFVDAGDTGRATANVNVQIDFLHFNAFTVAPNVTINRITIREYNANN